MPDVILIKNIRSIRALQKHPTVKTTPGTSHWDSALPSSPSLKVEVTSTLLKIKVPHLGALLWDGFYLGYLLFLNHGKT
jgi:hypothetical protein